MSSNRGSLGNDISVAWRPAAAVQEPVDAEIGRESGKKQKKGEIAEEPRCQPDAIGRKQVGLSGKQRQNGSTAEDADDGGDIAELNVAMGLSFP